MIVLLSTKRRWISTLCLLVCLWPAMSAYAAVGALFGTVEDKFSRERLGGGQNGYPRALFRLVMGSSQAEEEAFENGTYVIEGAPGSGYVLTVSAPGYQTIEVTGISLDAMKLIDLPVRLEPAETPDYAIMEVNWTRTSEADTPVEIRIANLNGIPPRDEVRNRSGAVPFFSFTVNGVDIPSVSRSTYIALDPEGCLAKPKPHRLLLTIPWEMIYRDLRIAGIWDEVIETEELTYRAEINPRPKIAAEHPEFRKDGNNVFETGLNREEAAGGTGIFEAGCLELPETGNGARNVSVAPGSIPVNSLRGSRVIRKNRSDYQKRYGLALQTGSPEPVPDAAGWVLADGESNDVLKQFHADPKLSSRLRMLLASKPPPVISVQELSPGSLDLVVFQRQSMAVKGVALQSVTEARLITLDGKPVPGVTTKLSGDRETRRTLAIMAGDTPAGSYHLQFLAGREPVVVATSLWPIRVSVSEVDKP